MGVPAIDTSFIGTFAYMRPATTIQLADVLPYFHTYQQYSEYVDGVMRIYETGGESGTYCDVYVRIRTDGWIMAFFPDDAHQGQACWGSYPWILENYDNRGNLLWWGHACTGSGNPPANSTRLGRALSELWDAVKANSDNPTYVFDYADVGYYDYEHTTAAKIYIFGVTRSGSSGITVHWYFTIPVGTTLLSGHANWSSQSHYNCCTAQLKINVGTGKEYTFYSTDQPTSCEVLNAAPYIYDEGIQNDMQSLLGAKSGYPGYMSHGLVLFADG